MAEEIQNNLYEPAGNVTLDVQKGDDLFAPEFTQAGHGFVVGDVVRRSSATAHTKAQADSESNIGVGLAIVIHVQDSNTYRVLRAGNSHAVALAAHGLGAFGTKLWLSQGTAGALTGTAPSSGLIVYLGYVIDAGNIHWEPSLAAFEI